MYKGYRLRCSIEQSVKREVCYPVGSCGEMLLCDILLGEIAFVNIHVTFVYGVLDFRKISEQLRKLARNSLENCITFGLASGKPKLDYKYRDLKIRGFSPSESPDFRGSIEY